MRGLWVLMVLVILAMLLPSQLAGVLLITAGAVTVMFSLLWLVGLILAGPLEEGDE